MEPPQINETKPPEPDQMVQQNQTGEQNGPTIQEDTTVKTNPNETNAPQTNNITPPSTQKSFDWIWLVVSLLIVLVGGYYFLMKKK